MPKTTKKTPVKKPASKKTVAKKEEDKLSSIDEAILKKISRKNRVPIAADIMQGLSDEELYEKYDYYSVEEMKREINKLKGNPWVCKTCSSY